MVMKIHRVGRALCVCVCVCVCVCPHARARVCVGGVIIRVEKSFSCHR